MPISSKTSHEDLHIELQGVATNNLKNIDVRFPLGKISVVTGVSGSGKSSLVFDTLYGEAYRRYVESLSSFARQYLKALPKPQVRAVCNLPAAIAVRQSRSGASNRSTVGTLTELVDILRILFTHLSEIYCTSCGALVVKDQPESIAQSVIQDFSGQKVLITAPLDAWGKIPVKELKAQLEQQGFSRIEKDGVVKKLAEAKAADLKSAAVVVDRVTVSEDGRSRLIEAAQLALKVGRGHVYVTAEAGGGRYFSSELECAACRLAYDEPSPALLSFNHPLGACSFCQGFGQATELDWDKVIPDRKASLVKLGVAPWNFGQFSEYYSWAKTSARQRGFDVAKTFAAYTDEDWEWLKQGSGRDFDGILGFFEYLERKKYKAHYRIHAARFRRYVLCPGCRGNRLNDKALACRLGGHNLAEVTDMSIEALSKWLERVKTLQPSPSSSSRSLETAGVMGVVEAIEEAQARLRYLERVGVNYLTLNRSSRSLSGGELQRINMARCLGSALTESLFCLDEPSSGLHARDSNKLLEVVRELRDQGNTVVLVEHERTLIKGADHLVEIGPKAGHEGGNLVYEGQPRGEPRSAAARKAEKAAAASLSKADFIELKGARTHNLQGVNVRFPLGAVTAVCGVSGSGKTSLIQQTLYPLLAEALGKAAEVHGGAYPLADGIGPLPLIQQHEDVLLVSQGALGRSTRSNVATYLGIMDEIRKLFAAQPLAKQLKLSAGAFSFNTPGGRCETCRGLGVVVEDLSFLGEMEVTCSACDGRRFRDEVLAVDIRGRNLIDILSLTVAEAREFFYDRPVIVKVCDIIIDMGMGYVTLGQHTSSFSGGEAQRLKLVSLMRDVKVARPSILIFDEPTTGLSDWDVANLLRQFRTLTAKGHTIIVVEHHLDVLRQADWLIEIGPEAAHRGGQLVYEGEPNGLTPAIKSSATAPYLA